MALVFVQSRTHTGSAVLATTAPQYTGGAFGTTYGILGNGQCGVQFGNGFSVSAELLDATSLASFLGFNLGGQVASASHTTTARILADFPGFSIGVTGGDRSVTAGADTGAEELVAAGSYTLTVTLTADVYQDSVTFAFHEQVTGCTATFAGMTLTITRTTGTVPDIWSGIAATRYVGPMSAVDGQAFAAQVARANMTWRGPSDPALRTQNFSAQPSAGMLPLPSVISSVDAITWTFDADFQTFVWPAGNSNGSSVTEVTGIDTTSFHNNVPSAYATTTSHLTCIVHATVTTITADKNGDLSTTAVNVVQRTGVVDSVSPLTAHNLSVTDAQIAKQSTGTDGFGNTIYTADLVVLYDANPSDNGFQYPDLNSYTCSKVTQTASHSLVNQTLTSTSTSGETGPCCLHDREGRLYIATCNSGGIAVLRCDSEKPPYTQTVLATSDGTDQSPALVMDTGRNLRLLYEHGGDVLEVVSGDFGDTWSSPTTMFALASHPRARCHPRSGVIVRLAWRSGTIVGTIQETPKGPIGAEFTLKDGSGVDIAAIDDAFDFSPANSLNEHLWVLIVRATSTVNKTYSSTDNCQTLTFEA